MLTELRLGLGHAGHVKYDHGPGTAAHVRADRGPGHAGLPRPVIVQDRLVI
jgi:hypothetical protein